MDLDRCRRADNLIPYHCRGLAGRTGHAKARRAGRVCHTVERGREVADLCRELRVSAHAFYSLKASLCGNRVSELRESRQLSDENRKPKTLVADLTLY